MTTDASLAKVRGTHIKYVIPEVRGPHIKYVIPEVRGTHVRNPLTFKATGCRIESGMTTSDHERPSAVKPPP